VHVKIKFSLRKLGNVPFDSSDVDGEIAALKPDPRKLEMIL
jgi:hypothetical protein